MIHQTIIAVGIFLLSVSVAQANVHLNFLKLNAGGYRVTYSGEINTDALTFFENQETDGIDLEPQWFLP